MRSCHNNFTKTIPFWTVGIWQDNRGFELLVTRSVSHSDMDGRVSWWTKQVGSSVGPYIDVTSRGMDSTLVGLDGRSIVEIYKYRKHVNW